MRINRNLLISLATVATFALPLFAQSKPDTDESKPLKFQPLPVHEKALTHPDEFFARLSDKVAKGTASSPEMRAWYELRRMYFPYTEDALPPKDWRARALAKGRTLEKPRKPFGLGAEAESSLVAQPEALGTFTWRHLGPTGFLAGDPPDASGVDVGTGRGTAIWVNPNDKNDIIAGFADGGVWKTTNQGSTWTQIFDFQDSLSIGSIAAITSGGQLDASTTIYVATGEGNFGGGGVEGTGVYKSIDGGASWNRQIIPFISGQSPDRTSIRRIALDPNDATKLWVAADSGIFRTSNGGTTWTLVTTLPYYGRSGDCWFVYWTDLAIDSSTTPSTIYAAGPRPFTAGCSASAQQDQGIYRSTDDGATWVNITQTVAACPAGRGYTCAGTGFAALPGNVGRITIVQAPSDKKHLYALLENKTNGQSLGIWETANAQNASVAWTARATTNYCSAQCWYDMTGAVNPTNAAQIIVGGLEAYISGNNAATLNKTSTWTGWGTTTYAHADHHHAIWVDATTVYLITDGGFYIGTVSGTGVNGVAWVDANGGFSAPTASPQNINTLQFYGIGQSPTQPYLIHGGLQDNGEAQSVIDGSGNIIGWTQTAGGDGGFAATNQTTGNITYEEYVYAIIARSTDSGSTYGGCIRNFGSCTTVTTRCSGNCVPDNATEFIAPIQLDANLQTVLFTGSKFVYRNANTAGNTWATYSPDLTAGSTAGDDIVHIHSAKNNNIQGTLWAGTTNGKVWMTTGATTATAPTWNNRTTATLPLRVVTWITTDPTNGQRAIVTFSGFNTGHVFRTTDGGLNWTDISGTLPNEPFQTAVIDPDTVNRPGRLYVGSDFGVYVIENIWGTSDYTTWTRINNGQLPNVKISQLEFSNAALTNGIKPLRAATHGRGIWELEEAACATPPTITSFSPTQGIATTSVVITGTNFTGATSVKFNGVTASFTVNSATQITATVPAGATSGKIAVTTSASCSATSSANFVVISAPTVSSFSPSGGCAGTSVVITGTNLDSVTAVKFNGTNAASFTINSGTQITAIAPVGVSSGTISVTNPAGTGTSVSNFTVISVAVSGFSPISGPIGTNVTITGTAFTGTSAVTFNGISASFTVNTDTEIIATVPAGATSGLINVTSTCGSASSASIFGVTGCDLPPTFAGLTSAAQNACSLSLSWSAGSSSCGGSVSYSVYRSTTNGFTPALANRIATNLSTTTYSDSAGLAAGTTYYYVVRGTDSSNGREETNAAQQSAVAPTNTGGTTTLFSGDFDAADTPAGHAWLVSRIDANAFNQWVIATNRFHNGTTAGRFAESTTGYRKNQNERIFLGGDGTNTPGVNGIALPASATSITMTFWHWYQIKAGGDAGFLEYSTTGATTGYASVLDTVSASVPYISSATLYNTTIGGQEGWEGNSGGGGTGAWVQVTVNLTPIKGSTVWLGWRGFSDNSQEDVGWYIDEVVITATTSGTACSAGPAASNAMTAKSTWDSGAGSGINKLELVDPATNVASAKILRKANSCPTSSSDGTVVYSTNTISPGNYHTWSDTGVASGSTYCYALYAYSGLNQTGTESAPRTVTAWNSNTLGTGAGQSPWIFATGASAMTPPAVTPGATGTGSVYALSNDRMMHGLNTGLLGGDWPRTLPLLWQPPVMNAPSQSRPAVLKLNATYEIGSADRASFVGSQDGYVYAVNANTGGLLWTTSIPLGDMVQASPAGYFRQFDAAVSKPSKDILLVGSRTASGASKFYGIDVGTGAILWTFDNGGSAIGVINSQATVDYTDYVGKRRVYFTSRRKAGGSSDTVWALEFDHTSATKLWSADIGDVDSSPALRSGLVYVGNNAGQIYAMNASTGLASWGPVATSDGPVKGFVWIDAAASRMYFVTTTKVWSLTLTGVPQWSKSYAAPTPVIRLGTKLYFGSGDGRVYELDNLLVTDPNAVTVKSVAVGPGTSAVGTPTYDNVNSMMYVGTEGGAIYPIDLPLP